MLNLHSALRVMPKGQDIGDLITVLYDTEYTLKVKDSIQQTVKDDPNTDSDILFDIIKCNVRCISIQCIDEKKK